jgi:Transposase DDE domain
MDRELWSIVLSAIKKAARIVGRTGRRPTFPDWLIVAMYVWSVWHDRPLSWACDRSHYGLLFRPRKLPSISQFTRRIKTDSCTRILAHVHDQLAHRGIMIDAACLDGKALLVSPVSKDRQATTGRISRGFGKGYKLHAVVTDRRRIVVWSVMGLNVAEQTVAAELLEHLPSLTSDALVMADSNYDSAPLQTHAASLGVCLINPLKGQRQTGPTGHHPDSLQRMGAARRSLVQAWKRYPDLMNFVLNNRDEIERALGVLVCTAGGLGNLPAWVRTLERVRRWVGVKIILYNARLEVQETLHPKAAA